MRQLAFLVFALVLISTAVVSGGCGGGSSGSGGGGATLVGRVLDVETGGPLNPAATVQVGSKTTSTVPEDGSFSLGVPTGTTSLIVLPNQNDWTSGSFTFSFPPANSTTAVGDLWVGPEKVSLIGRVMNSATSQPVQGAAVNFGGQSGITNASGQFTLTNVAYSSTTQTAFWGIVGSAKATGFFKTDFTAAPHIAVGGVVDVGDVLITPSNDPNPPGTPYNILGKVLPVPGSQGTIVRLKQGGTDVRIYNVGSDGLYYFWIAPGSYTVTFEKGAQTAPTQNAVINQPNDVVKVPDVTLTP